MLLPYAPLPISTCLYALFPGQADMARQLAAGHGSATISACPLFSLSGNGVVVPVPDGGPPRKLCTLPPNYSENSTQCRHNKQPALAIC